MAELSSQDVVNQVQSADGPASVDVSASTNTTLAAVAANSHAQSFNRSITPVPALDKSASDATATSESTQQSRGGAFSDATDHTSFHTTEKQLENGVNEDGGQADYESGPRSASGSIGQSALSEGEIGHMDGPDVKLKSGDAASRNAIKKPSTFKAVSVTKSFLAKAGTPVSQLSKSPSEATTPTTAAASPFASSSLRPRLVAKAGSGTKLSMSTQLGGANKAGTPAGPDPMQVWNRNRVQTPQATPKHLTNEELREQYGIQLASIPIGDGDDKGNKWADIDDEEDDWAPEVIEWSDGSKVNLADAERKAAAEKEKAAEEAKKREEAARAASLATRTPASLGPKATVLKVGGGATQSRGIGEGNATRPGDKPTLVAKPVAPTPVKSPWATLPPVDKIPPVSTNTQLPASGPGANLGPGPGPSRFQQQEHHFADRTPGPWRPAREMEADDFSRIPRGSPNAVPRELFNSQSGKYEPVGEGRRGSMQRGQNFRPASIVQRNASEQDNAMPMPRRRDSEAPSQPESEGTAAYGQQPQADMRNILDAQQPWRRQPGVWVPSHMRGNSQGSQSQEQPPPGPGETDQGQAPPVQQTPVAEGQTQEDAVTVQKRLMREKREAAIKRRQEEEAKEEAERKERIRKKLEAMGPPPEKKEKEKEMPQTQDQTTGAASLASPAPAAATLASRSGEEAAAQSAPAKEEMTRSPPKPPMPTTSGPPQQYGMLKIHPSPLPNGSSGAVPAQKASSASRPVESTGKFSGKPSPVFQAPTTASATEQRAGLKSSSDNARPENAHQDKSRWSNINSQASKGWERPSEVQNMMPSTSLWGPSTSNRTLSSSEFTNLNSQPRGQFRQQQISPDSILPSPQAVAPPRLFHEEKTPTPQPVGAHLIGAPGFATKPDSAAGTVSPFAHEISPVGTHAQTPANQSRAPGLPPPMTQTNSMQSSVPSGPKHFNTLPEPRKGLDAWANFSSNVSEHDAASRARLVDRNRHMMEASGPQAGQRLINETWKQVTRGEDLGTRQIINTHLTARSNAAAQSVPGVVDEGGRQPTVTMPPQHPRASRFHTFFGQHEHAPSQHAHAHMQTRAAGANRSQSPPPPESSFHPVFDRTSNRPRVRLPGQESNVGSIRPVVKLPPPKPIPQHPIVAELRGMPPPLRGPAQPLAKTSTWQHRFNGLFNKSPEKRPAELSEFSTSKAPFDVLSADDTASVHFPQPGQISPVSPRFAQLYARSRTIDEEEALFNGEQGPGSTPPVCVPPNKFPADWRPAPVPSPLLKRPQMTDMDIFSRFIWLVGLEDFHGKRIVVTVRLAGMKESKTLELKTANIQNPRMFGKNVAFQKGKPFTKPLRKPRETSTRPVGQLVPTSKPAPAPAPPAAPTTWAKRVSLGI